MLSLYNKDEKILIAGPLPKPLGGVSVHIKRLYNLLKDNNYDVYVYNLNKKKIRGLQWLFFIVKLLFSKYDVVHLHLFEPLFYPIILSICKKNQTRLILSIHNPTVKTKFKNYIKQLNNTDVIVAVGKHIIEEYKKNGIEFTTEVKIINSFLPPNESEIDEIEKSYPQKLFQFIKDNDKTMLVSAFKVIKLDDNVDLYGLDQSLKLIQKLIQKNYKVGLIIAIGDEKYNSSYISSLKSFIKNNSLDKHVYFIEGQKEIWPLFKRINLFLRPTFYDGYGISVAEAISLNCKAIASNVCERTPGTTTYNYNDFNDLLTKTEHALYD